MPTHEPWRSGKRPGMADAWVVRDRVRERILELEAERDRLREALERIHERIWDASLDAEARLKAVDSILASHSLPAWLAEGASAEAQGVAGASRSSQGALDGKASPPPSANHSLPERDAE